MSLVRISWIATVGVCLLAAVIVLLQGYLGYFGILLAIAASAAINVR